MRENTLKWDELVRFVAFEWRNNAVTTRLAMEFVENPLLLARPPEPRPDWALFLDADGTLFDIAESPNAVKVPQTLAATLAAANAWLGGALAIVSGRPIYQVDRLLSPLQLPSAGEHGAVVRTPGGALLHASDDCAVPLTWRRQLRAAAGTWDGVIVEDKPYGVTIHFRQAPSRELDARRLVENVVAGNPTEFEVLPAQMAFEIRHRSLNKATAIHLLLQFPPFPGRIPVFVGDDLADEDGFRAARQAGGLALRVEDVFQGRTSHVRRWLDTFQISAME